MNSLISRFLVAAAFGLAIPVTSGLAVPEKALADTINSSITGPKNIGPVNNRTVTVTRSGRISGGTSGLNVSGNNNRVVNNGSISATSNTSGTPAVGVSMTGGSSSITNSGTIRATSRSGSSSSAVGISQGN
jgi:hypothetical protein